MTPWTVHKIAGEVQNIAQFALICDYRRGSIRHSIQTIQKKSQRFGYFDREIARIVYVIIKGVDRDADAELD